MKALLAGFGLILGVAVAYQPAWHGGILFDDDAHITRLGLRSLAGLWRIWIDVGATPQYYPVVHSVFWVEHVLWGDTTLGYHLVSILLHGCSAVLVALILRRLKIPGAWFAAALFAFHPVQVESVAWITELKNTLSTFLYLSAFRVYLAFDERRDPGTYAGAIVLFVLGLLSKSVIASLPGALLVVFWWQRGRLDWRRDVRPLIPFIAIGVASGLFTAWVERTLIGASGVRFDLTLLQRCLLAGRVVWFYLGKIVWPVGLIFTYPRWTISGGVWWQYLFPVAALAMLAIGWAVRRRSRAPLAATLFFVGSLVPVLGFFNVYPFIFSFVADHFQYVATLGVITAAAAAATVALGRAPRWGRWIGQVGCGAVLLTLAVLTWRQSRMYGDAESLYRTTIAQNPDAWMDHQNLGVLLERTGRDPEAMSEFETALRLNPDLPEAHVSLGVALANSGRVPEGIEQLQDALRLKPDDPAALNDLGLIFEGLDRIPEAIQEYQYALTLRPDYPDAHDNLGVALERAGESDAAIAQYRDALKLVPHYAQAENNLGDALMATGRVPEAIDEYREALRLSPDNVDVNYNLGVALLSSGNNTEAIEYLAAAVRLKPEFAEAQDNLGIALARCGRLAEAIEHLEDAIRIRPDYEQAKHNLLEVQRLAHRH